MKEKKPLNVQIGRRIAESRNLAGLTQEQLAEAIDVTPQYLSDLERGVVGTSVSTLIILCSKLHISSDYVLFGNTRENDVSMIIERIRFLPEDQLQMVERSIKLTLEALEKDPTAALPGSN